MSKPHLILIKHSLYVVLLLAALMEFWKLGDHPINSFDEARFGANAYEMAQNGDFLNLHYQGKPDAWVARPPLKAWLIMIGYKIFGYNTWGLRFSSGLFILLFFCFTYKWLQMYLGKNKAFLGCLILLSVKGILGFHVGRNGDMDAELLAFLAGFLFFFGQYLHFGKQNAIVVASVFLSFAFWLKTVAAFFYLPGIVLFLAFSHRIPALIKDRKAWLAFSILVLSIASWILIVTVWGSRYENTQYAGDNAIETMLVYDVWMRFTASHFDGHPVLPSYDFFFTNLDSRFNVWNYLFYLGMGIFLFQKWKGSVIIVYSKILPFCAYLILPVFVLLTVAMHKLDWYSAPALPLLLVFVMYAVDFVSKKWGVFSWLVMATLLFTLCRQVIYLDSGSEEENETAIFEQNKGSFLSADTLWVIGDVPQNIYLSMLWTEKKIEIAPNIHFFSQKAGRIGFCYAPFAQNEASVRQLAEYADERLGIDLLLVKSTN